MKHKRGSNQQGHGKNKIKQNDFLSIEHDHGYHRHEQKKNMSLIFLPQKNYKTENENHPVQNPKMVRCNIFSGTSNQKVYDDKNKFSNRKRSCKI